MSQDTNTSALERFIREAVGGNVTALSAALREVGRMDALVQRALRGDSSALAEMRALAEHPNAPIRYAARAALRVYELRAALGRQAARVAVWSYPGLVVRPATLVLVGSVLVGLIVLGRRRKRRE